MDSDDSDYLSVWQKDSQGKRPAGKSATLRPARLSRAGTPRKEPGTLKVDEHEVKRKAVVLLYAMAESLKQPIPESQAEFVEQIQKDIEEVVAGFGFTQSTIQAAGEKLRNSIMDQINLDQHIKDLDDQAQILMARIEAMKTAHQAQRGAGLDVGATADGNSVNSVRSTRGGNSMKRDRDISDVEKQIEAMQALCKRMKTKDTNDEGHD